MALACQRLRSNPSSRSPHSTRRNHILPTRLTKLNPPGISIEQAHGRIVMVRLKLVVKDCVRKRPAPDAGAATRASRRALWPLQSA